MKTTLLRYLLPALLVIAAFFGGTLVGRDSCYSRPFDFKHRKEMRQQALDRMSETLQLSAEQRSEVETILVEQGKNFRQLREEIHPKFKELHHQTNARILAVLDQGQAEIFKSSSDKLLPWQKRRGFRHERARE